MKLYHGSDSPRKLRSVKDGRGYHVGAGPVEFLGPAFSDNKEVALSYGKYIIEVDVIPQKVKKHRSLNALKNDIIRTFGLPTSGQNIGNYYRDIADSYRVKLLTEGYDVVMFPEGGKTSPDKATSNTVILLDAEAV